MSTLLVDHYIFILLAIPWQQMRSVSEPLMLHSIYSICTAKRIISISNVSWVGLFPKACHLQYNNL